MFRPVEKECGRASPDTNRGDRGINPFVFKHCAKDGVQIKTVPNTCLNDWTHAACKMLLKYLPAVLHHSAEAAPWDAVKGMQVALKRNLRSLIDLGMLGIDMHEL